MQVDYAEVCKHVGKIVLEHSFEMERLAEQMRKAVEDFKKTIDEKNARIKELEKQV
jgi:uncharacterized coiled-coil protein SlyX